AVQANRLDAAARLAALFQCGVVLKGSGTVIAAPGAIPVINPTGNARLATAGTGDVLAGMLGAALAAGLPALEAACSAVFQHGRLADDWPTNQSLTASRLAENHQADLQQEQQHQR
ncbi:MAG: NAD(P)H-hydrate dehydratase, partial [Polaromonas sp.]|nr:NAD(P)H-hydrate dehydratase [Polaromonas sp.]